MDEIKEKIKHLGKDFDPEMKNEEDITYFYSSGFNNSKDTPAKKRNIEYAAYFNYSEANSKLLELEKGDIELLPVNKDILSTLGAKTREAYVDIDGQKMVIKEGDFIIVDSKNIGEVLTAKEINLKGLKIKPKPKLKSTRSKNDTPF